MLWYAFVYLKVKLEVISLILFSGRPSLQVRIDKTRLEIEEGRSARFVCTVTGTSREVSLFLVFIKYLKYLVLYFTCLR